MVSPPWALIDQILECLGQIAPSERDKLNPAILDSAQEICTHESRTGKHKTVAVRFIKFSFQDGFHDVSVHVEAADQGDLHEVLGHNFSLPS